MNWKTLDLERGLRFYTIFAVLTLTSCGEPMQFENAGSKQALVQDEAACNQELSQSTSGVAYAQAAQGQVDPLQVCIERKGWKRVDRPLSELARKQL